MFTPLRQFQLRDTFKLLTNKKNNNLYMTGLETYMFKNMNRKLNTTIFSRLLYVFSAVFSLSTFHSGTATAKELTQTLEGKIIRSYAFNPKDSNQILVGIKGESASSGKVYYSDNAGKTWQMTNSGDALSAASEDVQTLAFLDDKTFMAGTWKNGLFISSDSGAMWQTYPEYPSNDIRAIRVGLQHEGKVYIATTTSWVTSSNDSMKTWEQLEQQKMANWDLIVDPSNDQVLYALTFRSGVHKSEDGGQTWSQILEMKNNMMIFDLLVDSNGSIVAVGSNETSSIIVTSANGGESWEHMPDIPHALLNSVEVVNNKLIVGSWDKGVYKQQDDHWSILADMKDTGITKIKKSGEYIYYFTWGNGVFRELL